MTGSLAGLLVANLLYLVIGVALLPLLRMVRTRNELAARLGLGYMLGVAAVGALSAFRSACSSSAYSQCSAAFRRGGCPAASRGSRVTPCHLTGSRSRRA